MSEKLHPSYNEPQMMMRRRDGTVDYVWNQQVKPGESIMVGFNSKTGVDIFREVVAVNECRQPYFHNITLGQQHEKPRVTPGVG
jgi:hypothetical protein